ncbi:MAG: urease accessory protein UreD [Pseudomonadota bacterium]
MRAKRRAAASVLSDLRASGSLKALFPQVRSAALDVVFLNTAGGMTGGDVFEIDAQAEENARLTLTTQAAERIYGAVDPDPAHLTTYLHADAGARIDWLPQETIVFDRAALRRRLDVDLAGDATFLMVEPLVFGRQTMGETVDVATLADDVRVSRDGHLVFADAVRLSGDVHAALQGPATARGHIAMASVLYAAPDAEAHLAKLQRMMPETGGVSLIRDGVLFARMLAPDSYLLRQALVPVVAHLQGGPLPKTWML